MFDAELLLSKQYVRNEEGMQQTYVVIRVARATELERNGVECGKQREY